MEQLEQPQPFAGVTVIEFGQFIAVPYASMLLAEGGATVIKVEALEGDSARHLGPLIPGESRYFLARNRGKRSLPLKLKHPLAAGVVERLIAGADVVLTNLRPGLGVELGLDGATLVGRHPRLIVGNVTAFGAVGPDAALAGMDLVVQARSGLMAANGRMDGELPNAGDPPIVDYACAVMLAFGIASALLRREHSGQGGEVDASLLMAGMTLQSNFLLRVESLDGATLDAGFARLAELRQEQATFKEQVAALPSVRLEAIGRIYCRTYQTKDAILAVAAASPALQRAFMRSIGLDDRAFDEVVPASEQVSYYNALASEVEAALRMRANAEWKAHFNRHGVPAGDVKLPLELIDDEQTNANGMIKTTVHNILGPIRHLASPVSLSDGGFRSGPFASPLGSETVAILAEAGFSAGEIEELLTAGVTRETGE